MYGLPIFQTNNQHQDRQAPTPTAFYTGPWRTRSCLITESTNLSIISRWWITSKRSIRTHRRGIVLPCWQPTNFICLQNEVYFDLNFLPSELCTYPAIPPNRNLIPFGIVFSWPTIVNTTSQEPSSLMIARYLRGSRRKVATENKFPIIVCFQNYEGCLACQYKFRHIKQSPLIIHFNKFLFSYMAV